MVLEMEEGSGQQTRSFPRSFSLLQKVFIGGLRGGLGKTFAEATSHSLDCAERGPDHVNQNLQWLDKSAGIGTSNVYHNHHRNEKVAVPMAIAAVSLGRTHFLFPDLRPRVFALAPSKKKKPAAIALTGIGPSRFGVESRVKDVAG